MAGKFIWTMCKWNPKSGTFASMEQYVFTLAKVCMQGLKKWRGKFKLTKCKRNPKSGTFASIEHDVLYRKLTRSLRSRARTSAFLGNRHRPDYLEKSASVDCWPIILILFISYHDHLKSSSVNHF